MQKIAIFISVSLLAVAAFAQDTTLVVTEEDNVGIGTMNPETKFHIIGNRWFLNTHSTSNVFSIGKVGISDDLVINESGRVGIGTTDPTALLHVNGSAIKPGGGEWGAPSDRRLKKNIKPLENALYEMTRLRGVTYEWKKAGEFANQNGQQMGMIAQEVEQVFPEWVRTGIDGYRILEIRGFSALTVEAVRELKQENESLKKQLTETNERLEALEKIVSQIQSRQTGIALK